MYWCNKMYVLHVFNFEFLIFFFICVAMYLGVAFLWGVVCENGCYGTRLLFFEKNGF